MSNDTVLDIEEIENAGQRTYGTMLTRREITFARAIEQAVLQSPEVQRLREDARRWSAYRKAFADNDRRLLSRVQEEMEKLGLEEGEYPTESQIDSSMDIAMVKQP